MASKRDKIRLISSANTGHFYTTDKNKKNTPTTMRPGALGRPTTTSPRARTESWCG